MYHKIIKTKYEIALKVKTINGKQVTNDSCNVFDVPEWENRTNTYKNQECLKKEINI